MTCASSMSRALEIDSNDRLKQEHVKSYPSFTKNLFPLTQCIWPPNFGRVVTYHEWLPPIDFDDPLMAWSCQITWQPKTYLDCQSVYGHQTLQDGNLPWWVKIHKIPWHWSHGLARSHDDKLKRSSPLLEYL